MRVATSVCLLLLFVCSGIIQAAPIQGPKSEEPDWHFDLSWANSDATYPEVEPNNACPGQQVNCGDIVDPAAITPVADVDWYTFYATAGTPLTIGTDQVTGQPTMDTVIYLFSDDCVTQLTWDDDGGPSLFSLITSFPAPYSGVYNLKVIEYGNNATGAYKAFFNCTPPATGACCLGANNCQVLTQAACATAGGIYQGDNTLCDPQPCVPPPNDVCATAIEILCGSGNLSGNSAFATNDYALGSPSCTGYSTNGKDVVYFMNVCVGDAVDMTYTSALDGAFYFVTDCSDPTATCLVGADATVTGQPEVISWVSTVTGIVYVILDNYTSSGGAWTLIYTIGCHSSDGACCTPDGLCTVTPREQCPEPNIWMGVCTVCDPNPCPHPPEPGACCRIDGTCYMVLQEQCVAPDAWLGGSCEPNRCPQPPEPGACCRTDGTCYMVLQTQCVAPDVWYGGSCQPNPCPPTPTEKTSWGQIKSQYR